MRASLFRPALATLLVTCSIVATSTVAQRASACSCPRFKDTSTELSLRDAVFEGAVSHEEELTQQRRNRYQIAVRKVWKGTPQMGETISVESAIGGSFCGVKMELGTDYLVFAELDHAGSWEVHSCSRTARSELRLKEMEELDEIINQPNPPSEPSQKDVATGNPSTGEAAPPVDEPSASKELPPPTEPSSRGCTVSAGGASAPVLVWLVAPFFWIVRRRRSTSLPLCRAA